MDIKYYYNEGGVEAGCDMVKTHVCIVMNDLIGWMGGSWKRLIMGCL